MLCINISKVLTLKLIDKISVKCFCVTVLSVLPFFPFLPNRLCFLFWQNPVFVFRQIHNQFQLSQHRCWQFLWEVYEVNKNGNDSHVLESRDSPRIYEKRIQYSMMKIIKWELHPFVWYQIETGFVTSLCWETVHPVRLQDSTRLCHFLPLGSCEGK